MCICESGVHYINTHVDPRGMLNLSMHVAHPTDFSYTWPSLAQDPPQPKAKRAAKAKSAPA